MTVETFSTGNSRPKTGMPVQFGKTATKASQAEAEMEVFRDLVRGGLDLHTHFGQDTFDRESTAPAMLQQASDYDLGLLFKAHDGATHRLANALREMIPGSRVFGGQTLNYHAGGLNPYSVDAALALGANIIWLPTIHAVNHGENVGPLGGFHFQTAKTKLTPEKGIWILDENGRPTKPLREILDLINEHDKPVLLATGHISGEEIKGLKDYIKKEKLTNIRLLINHAFFDAPNLSTSDIADFADGSTAFEQTWLSAKLNPKRIDAIAKGIHEIPQARFVLSSDTGQAGNMGPVDALADFARRLSTKDVPHHQLKKMIADEPKAFLLGE